MTFDKVSLGAISDLLINLSAGWFASVLIVPNFTHIRSSFNILILIADVIWGIVCLVVAIKLKRSSLKRR